MAIIPYRDQNFDLHIPVCVIGAGGCGLTAAIRSAQGGAEVVVFEKDSTPGGSTSMTISLISAAGTKSQKQHGIIDTPNDLYNDILRATRGQTDENLARLMAEQSGPTIDWLCEDVGCDLDVETTWNGYGHSVLRCHGTPNGTGEEIIAMLLEGAENAGVTLLTNTSVKDLIVDDTQTIIGLISDTPNGEIIVSCDALILASGGYGANKDLVSRFIPKMSKGAYHGSPNHQGDAFLWGEALGAEIADMGAYQGVGTHTAFGFGLPHTVLMEGGFKVNLHGKRFENELSNLSTQAVDLMSQPGGVSWTIYDQRIHEKTASLFDRYCGNANLIEKASRADTLEAISTKTKIDIDGLSITFSEVEKAVKTETRDAYNRHFSSNHLLEPPYYAVKVTSAIYHTQGGLCIDTTARVKRANGDVFPNLFAGGGAARSVSGPAEWGYLPAMGLATAVVFGRIAGEQAAKLIQQTR